MQLTWRTLSALAIVALMGSCAYLITPPSPEVRSTRFRLLVELETDAGPRFGETIFELQTKSQTFSPLFIALWGGTPERAYPITRLVGEAAVIDLPNQAAHGVQHIFVTTIIGSPGQLGTLQAVVLRHLGDSVEKMHATPIGTRFSIDRLHIPILVVFTKLPDPTSALQVAPESLRISLSRPVEFKRATIEVTGLPVTKAIEKRFPDLLVALKNASSTLAGRISDTYQPNISDFWMHTE